MGADSWVRLPRYACKEIRSIRYRSVGMTKRGISLGRYDGSERKNEVIRPVRRAVGGVVLK